MSKRVYEIAKELSLDTKEVMNRLNAAGVEVKNHFAAVEEPVYERVFGDSQNAEAAVPVAADGAANGRTESPAEPPKEAAKSGKGGRKRRRVVIDASATNRAPRPTAVETPQKEAPKVAAAMAEAKQEEKGVVRVEPGATVKDLADALEVAPTQIIKVLMGLGEMKTMTQTLYIEEIELISEEMGVEVMVAAVE